MNGETWREHVDRELTHLREKIDLQLVALREAWAQQVKDAEHRLAHQAKEYERRLGELNHEAARIQRAAALSVSQEAFDGYRNTQASELRALREQVIAEAASRATRTAMLGTLLSVSLIVAGWIFAWLINRGEAP